MVWLDAPEVAKRIGMDNVDRALAEMPPVARSLVDASGDRISQIFCEMESAHRWDLEIPSLKLMPNWISGPLPNRVPTSAPGRH